MHKVQTLKIVIFCTVSAQARQKYCHTYMRRKKKKKKKKNKAKKAGANNYWIRKFKKEPILGSP